MFGPRAERFLQYGHFRSVKIMCFLVAKTFFEILFARYFLAFQAFLALKFWYFFAKNPCFLPLSPLGDICEFFRPLTILPFAIIIDGVDREGRQRTLTTEQNAESTGKPCMDGHAEKQAYLGPLSVQGEALARTEHPPLGG